jgi:phage terminase small subunit
MQKNGSQKKKLTRLQRAAVAAIVTTSTNSEAAAVAGCSERSIYVWLKDPNFKAAVAEYESMVREAVRHQLAIGAREALNVVEGVYKGDIVDTEDLKVSVRLRAALGWLDLHIRTGDESDLEARVTKLEARDK